MLGQRSLVATVKARVVGSSVSGIAIVSPVPISFLGDVDRTSGNVIAPENPLYGVSIAGKVLVTERTRGSTVGAYILYALAKRGKAPRAIVVSKPDPVIIAGAVISRITYAYNVPHEVVKIVRCGDLVEIDAERGEVRVWREGS